MADITTPTTARKTEDFTPTQRVLVKNSLGIGDYPYQPEKTYIVFDADSGDNDLHIDTGASSTYSILPGDGQAAVSYTDTGGTKTISYDVAGRYLITIEGTFNGINTTGARQSAKDKYIEVVSGNNYPTTIVTGALSSCRYLQFIKLNDVTAIDDSAFAVCIRLREVYLPLATTIGNSSFLGCSKLKNIELPSATLIGDTCFKNCFIIDNIAFPYVTSLGDSTFEDCNKLSKVSLPLVTAIGNNCFKFCNTLETLIIPGVSSIGGGAFIDCYRLSELNLISTSAITIGALAFSSCSALRTFSIRYNASHSFGARAFDTVSLFDLYVRSAPGLTEATAVQTKVTTAGATLLTGYRLLY